MRLRLYIPHGSDNTNKIFIAKFKDLIFISHMVQIIHIFNMALFRIMLSFISHMVQIILRIKINIDFTI